MLTNPSAHNRELVATIAKQFKAFEAVDEAVHEFACNIIALTLHEVIDPDMDADLTLEQAQEVLSNFIVGFHDITGETIYRDLT